jgi:eukaryotic-like serine/threonine-protein kinase
MATDERWVRVKALFAEVLERPPERREAFLAACCAGDPATADEVRSLLAAHDAAGRFIETPAGEVAARNASRPAYPPGALIGVYRIVREVGHGGMGAVYLAARADGAFDKNVALKVVRRGLDTDEILQRFRHERQTLADLDHPNIARLLDGGTTAEGLPFFVMEYVEGTPIDQYCDERTLTVAERLDLFHTLALAVQAAHRNLVVHRDLKPDNVLVTADGTLKLLDFGIAKVLAPHPGSVTETHGGRLMTPAYASPEQLLGQPITTATDIFSLGILLYELLTGRRPFPRTTGDDRSIERAICEAMPVRPSSVVAQPLVTAGSGAEVAAVPPEALSSRRGSSPASLGRQLAGDLDAIVAMAMRKEPGRRYGSAEQFAEDIRRHRMGLPVAARKGVFSYRAGKFVRRHAAAVGTAALLGAALTAGLGTIVWQARVVAVERDRARVEGEKAREMSAFLQDMLRSPDPQNSGRTVTVVDTLDRAVRRLDAETRMDPEVRAGLRHAIGATYAGLGMYDVAERQLRAALAALPARSPEGRAEIAGVETDLAGVISSRGDTQTAEALFRHALAGFATLGLRDDLRRADALNGLGEVLRGRGDDAGAEARYREALELRRRLRGGQDVLVAESLNNLAVVMHGRNNLAEAEGLYREALAILRAARGDDHPGVPATLTNLATVVGSRGDMAGSEQLYREALAIRRRLLGDAHPDVAFTMYALADTLLSLGRYDQSAALCREVLSRRGTSLPADHPLAAASLLILGKALVEQGHAREAEAPLREALAVRRSRLPAGHWQTASAESALGRCLARQGRFREAEPLVVGSYERLLADRGPRHERTRDALANVIDLYDRWKMPARAAEFRARQGI